MVLVALVIGSAYWFFSAEEEANEVVIVPPITPVNVIQPEAKLRVEVTACQKLSTTIPLDVSFVTQSENLRIAKGYVENVGHLAVRFVQVQVVWKDKTGDIIDYNDVFAVTEETLNPGERAEFQTSQRNYEIERCGARILDWWTVDQENPGQTPESSQPVKIRN